VDRHQTAVGECGSAGSAGSCRKAEAALATCRKVRGKPEARADQAAGKSVHTF
jgi:hypothetical protein